MPRCPCSFLSPSADNRVGSLQNKLSEHRKDGKERFKDAGNVTLLRTQEG